MCNRIQLKRQKKIVEPHALGNYAICRPKTFCHLRNSVPTLMLNRIASVKMLEESCTSNPEIYEAAKPGIFFQFKQIPNIKIRFHRSLHDSFIRQTVAQR